MYFLMPWLAATFNPGKSASYSTIFMVQVKFKVKEYLNAFLFGEIKTTLALDPSLELTPSKYIVYAFY